VLAEEPLRFSITKSKKDPIREERIHNEVVVDAYGAKEQAMGWYFYLEDKIRFPFQAAVDCAFCRLTKCTGTCRIQVGCS
jgi:hypothetical protein